MPRRLRLLVLALFAVAACRGGPPGTPTAGPIAAPPPATPAVPAATSTPSVRLAPTPIPAVRSNKWGVHLLLDDGVSQWPVEVWGEHLDYARWLTGAGGYVVELIRADDLDVRKWQRFLDAAAARQLTPILRLATWQDRARGHWVAPPKDSNGRTYRELAGRFAAFVAGIRSAGPLYVLVGNEPNRADEWGGQPNPAEYAQYLLDVSSALHTAAPGRVLVLNAGLDQYAPDTGGRELNGVRSYDAATFLDGIQAANPRVWQAIDLWASHAYPLGPFGAEPGARDFRIDDLTTDGAPVRVAPWPGLYNRGLNSYRWELYKLRSYGVTRPLKVFVTETGWRHFDSQGRSIDDAGANILAEQAAAYILLAFDGDPHLAPQEYTWTPWSADAEVAAVAVFALDGDPSRWGHTNLLDLGPNGEVLGLKPQFVPLVKR